MRVVAWVAPLLVALRNIPELKTKQGVLRAIVNFSMDSMLQKYIPLINVHSLLQSNVSLF